VKNLKRKERRALANLYKVWNSAIPSMPKFGPYLMDSVKKSFIDMEGNVKQNSQIFFMSSLILTKGQNMSIIKWFNQNFYQRESFEEEAE